MTTTTKVWPHAFASVTKTEGPRTVRLFIPNKGKAEVTVQDDNKAPITLVETEFHGVARSVFNRAAARLLRAR